MSIHNIAAHAKLKIRIELRRLRALSIQSKYSRYLINPLMQSQFSHDLLKRLSRWADDIDSNTDKFGTEAEPVVLTPQAQEIYERLKSKIKEVEAIRFANRN